ncbi:IS66 family insertion sequence element accessory protein TnpB [Thiomonas sp. 13-64-67]|jgi:hypothetical protein|uniref:IS66 family insertion sequence element accessory protein TnpB n=1 Tax=Thiomonas sp. 13-64-67 TaxID=1970447 RepID=UPI000BC6A45F|nr:IS66 family insertion sequence element accessory protein TnpB [Thiomonas sp. 13-64-67]OZB68822.1 MAG: transposase [Thiomonas sp. 13-64-67]
MEERVRKDKLGEDDVRRRLELIDAYKASGLSAAAFAQSRGIGYLDLRGWAAHAPRWRAWLAGEVYAAPARVATAFVKAQPNEAPAAAAGCARIVCEVGSRRVQVDWPVAAPAECAQWLRAWLG